MYNLSRWIFCIIWSVLLTLCISWGPVAVPELDSVTMSIWDLQKLTMGSVVCANNSDDSDSASKTRLELWGTNSKVRSVRTARRPLNDVPSNLMFGAFSHSALFVETDRGEHLVEFTAASDSVSESIIGTIGLVRAVPIEPEVSSEGKGRQQVVADGHVWEVSTSGEAVTDGVLLSDVVYTMSDEFPNGFSVIKLDTCHEAADKTMKLITSPDYKGAGQKDEETEDWFEHPWPPPTPAPYRQWAYSLDF